MSPSEKDALKDQVDILSLCSMLNINLKKSGKSYMARCPFADHEDKNPSFSVDQVKGLYHCFGCGRKGDVIKLVQELKGLSFKDSLTFLDQQFNGGQYDRQAKQTAKQESDKMISTVDKAKLLTKVLTYYHDSLKTNNKAIEYLKKRGIYSEKLIAEFKIGFCQRRDLNNHISIEERNILLEIGIIKDNLNKTEHLSNCITFPILSKNGELLEFYGRKIRDRRSEGYPSHLYLKGTHKGVFNQNAFLYDELIICESIIDAMTFMVNGIMNVTASYGTNGFTADHLKLLTESRVNKVIIAYDNDQAGDKGTERLVEIIKAIEKPIEIKRVILPGGLDINAYALTFSTEQRVKMLTKLVNETVCLFMPRAKKQQTNLVQTDKEIIMTKADRVYRLRGMDNNNSIEHLKINLKVSTGQKFHLDVIDLYSAKQRTAFMKQAAIILEIEQNTLFNDMALLIEQAEALHDNMLAGSLNELPQEYKMTEAEEAAAMKFLSNPDLLKELLDDFDNMGYVGETENKLIGYFCARSCKMAEPLSVMVISRSSAGKSALQDAVLSFTPDEDKIKFTSMTGQSLFYMDKDSLKHKVLAISENEGALGAFYAIKTMQSERELNIASTGKDPKTGRMKTHHYHVKGPISLLLTTTSVELDDEVANRFIDLTVDEGCEQTVKIHERQRFEKTLEGYATKTMRNKIALKQQNAARLLRKVVVINPFANQLSFLANKLRARRDNQKYLNLIDAITFVFQYQRQIKQAPAELGGFDYIETTVEDIKLANRLARHIFAKSLDDLAPHSKKLLNIIMDLVEKRIAQREEQGITSDEPVKFSRREIREFSGWDHWQVRDHIKQLEELEYIIPTKGRKGQRYEYELNYCSKDGEGFSIQLVDPKELIRTELKVVNG